MGLFTFFIFVVTGMAILGSICTGTVVINELILKSRDRRSDFCTAICVLLGLGFSDFILISATLLFYLTCVA